MSNSEGSSNCVPIFGRRKRLRAPLFAESIGTDFGLDDEDDLLFGGDVNDGKRQIVQGGARQREMVGCNDGTSNSYQSGTSMNNNGTSERNSEYTGNVQCSSSKYINNSEKCFENNDYSKSKSVHVKGVLGTRFGGESGTASLRSGVIAQGNDGVIPTEFKKPLKEKEEKEYAKLVTTVVSGLMAWKKCMDEKPIIFEVYGKLSSAIEYCSKPLEEVFKINDGVGGDDLRCVFWPIDRRLPQVSCGVKVRVIGFLKDEYFQVLTMREVLSDEMQVLILMSQRSEEVMQNEANEEFLMQFNYT